MFATPKVPLLYQEKIQSIFQQKKQDLRLKQGDVISTFLLNLYINDLTDFLNKGSNTDKNLIHIRQKYSNSTHIQDSYSFLHQKKHKGIENLLKKALKAQFAIQKLLFKSNKKTLDTYLHLVETLLSQLHFAFAKAGAIGIKKAKLKQSYFICYVAKYQVLLKQLEILAELGRLPFKIFIEKKLFKYLQGYSFLEGNSYLKKAINQETKTTNSGWIANLKYIIDSYGLSNLMINILKVVEGDKVRKTANHKFFIINIISFKKEIKTAFFRKTSSPALPER